MVSVKFAFVVDGEFAGSFEVNENHANFEHLCAVMRSAPKVVEISDQNPQFSEIKMGWIYDEGNWIEPTE